MELFKDYSNFKHINIFHYPVRFDSVR